MNDITCDAGNMKLSICCLEYTRPLISMYVGGYPHAQNSHSLTVLVITMFVAELIFTEVSGEVGGACCNSKWATISGSRSGVEGECGGGSDDKS